jgi:uncharacterized protein (UPF0548 family)
MFLTRRPSTEQIKQFLDDSQHLSLSYGPVGIARESPRGFKVDEARAVIGHGLTAFNTAKQALGHWRHFDLGWVELHPQTAPVETGVVVAVLVHHLGIWSLNGCRIVYLTHDDEKASAFGFAYGTLANHAELGEEIFEVSFDAKAQEVIYRIRAVSKPRAALALAGYPVTRMFQERFRRDSIAAMKRAARGAPPDDKQSESGHG